jgi:hypothetical protein
MAITVDSTDVYWLTGEGQIYKCPITGCPRDADGGSTPVLVATGLGMTEGQGAIAVDAANVYWLTLGYPNPATVAQCPLGGCATPTVLSTANGCPWGLAVTATHVYWSDDCLNVVRRTPIGGSGGPTTFAATLGATGMAIDSTTVYWTSSQGWVGKCPLTGCPIGGDGGALPTELASGQDDPLYIAVDSANVYWLNQGNAGVGSVAKCPVQGCPSVADGGSEPTLLATNQARLFGIALDSDYVYWVAAGSPTSTSPEGVVAKCSIDGCGGNPTILASGLDTPNCIAVDNRTVYWGNTDVIMKVAK